MVLSLKKVNSIFFYSKTYCRLNLFPDLIQKLPSLRSECHKWPWSTFVCISIAYLFVAASFVGTMFYYCRFRTFFYSFLLVLTLHIIIIDLKHWVLFWNPFINGFAQRHSLPAFIWSRLFIWNVSALGSLQQNKKVL